jgi:DNA invertase Pin-like site-specific DNA recombinase
MSRKKENASTAPAIRCAIYTRKSTEEGLEQEYNSLDAQRDAGEAYIKSQQHEGWVCLPGRYDDGGYTGANMDRPAMRRLLADIEAGKIDCVVVYKVDRLSRSLLDFSRIMETFERHKVSFVSVTQAFNTASSMGRLVLNVLLSFAQFEREMIDQLIRDGAVADQADLARLGHVTRARLTPIMNLMSLAPDIQEAILFLPATERGRESITERDLRPVAAMADWRNQRRMWAKLACPQ